MTFTSLSTLLIGLLNASMENAIESKRQKVTIGFIRVFEYFEIIKML